jgi:hypothetical protein
MGEEDLKSKTAGANNKLKQSGYLDVKVYLSTPQSVAISKPRTPNTYSN